MKPTKRAIQAACDIARKRVSAMTVRQRQALLAKGLMQVYHAQGPLAFKVVRPYTYGNGDKGLVSSNNWLPEKLQLSYRKGRWTKPVVGKVFVFSNFRDAQNFASRRHSVRYEVWLVQAKGLEKKNFNKILRFDDLYEGTMAAFWGGETVAFTKSPRGTRLCDAVKMLRRLDF